LIAHAGQKDVVIEVMPENTNWLELNYE
jgi:hypothetical protein